MKQFGLIGYPLSHSFSKGYFADKFLKENITDSKYDTFPLENIEDIIPLCTNFPNLAGLNVTIPYKEQVIPYLDALDEVANAIGAVNTIKFLLVKGESSIAVGNLKELRKSYNEIMNQNKSILL